MAHEYKLTIKSNDTNKYISLSGNITDEDWNRLNNFTQYADDLLKTKFVEDGMSSYLNIHWNKDTGMNVSTKLPPWDDVIVYLHKLRPILLRSESTHFYNICNILSKILDHIYLRTMVENEREIYGAERIQKLFKIKSNNVVINSDETLSDWLNAYEYHRDEDKRKLIEGLHTMFPIDASKALFIILLSDKAIAINNINSLVKVVIGKQTHLKGLIRFSE